MTRDLAERRQILARACKVAKRIERDRIRKQVKAWQDEAKDEADKSYEYARPYILAEVRMKCYQLVLDLLGDDSGSVAT